MGRRKEFARQDAHAVVRYRIDEFIEVRSGARQQAADQGRTLGHARFRQDLFALGKVIAEHAPPGRDAGGPIRLVVSFVDPFPVLVDEVPEIGILHFRPA